MSSSSSTTRIRGRSFIPASYHPNLAIPAPRGDSADVARVLICEPHDDIGALLELVVRRLGHEPVAYDDGGAADLSAFDAAVIEPGDERGPAACACVARDERARCSSRASIPPRTTCSRSSLPRTS